MGLDGVKLVIKNDLLKAQREYVKKPNAANWNATLRMMLAHQQLTYPGLMFMQSALDKLMADLDKVPPGEWPELIVKHVTGRTIQQALEV